MVTSRAKAYSNSGSVV